MSENKFIPRGYVDRDRWLWINDICDPGDAARNCPVHFIPNNVNQLSSMVQMMSVEEHYEETKSLRASIKDLQESLETIKQIKFIAGTPNLYDESKHTEYCKTKGCYGHWTETKFPNEVAKEAIDRLRASGNYVEETK